jgi:hypothetical protein
VSSPLVVVFKLATVGEMPRTVRLDEGGVEELEKLSHEVEKGELRVAAATYGLTVADMWF